MSYECMDSCAGPRDYLVMDGASPMRSQYSLGKLESTALGYFEGSPAALYAPIEGVTH